MTRPRIRRRAAALASIALVASAPAAAWGKTGAFSHAAGELMTFSKTANLPGGHISDIAFAPSAPSTVYLASNVNAMGIWKSTDAGVSWARVFGANFENSHPNAIAVHPADADTVFTVDIHRRVGRTTDGGVTWSFVFEEFGGSAFTAAAIGPASPYVLYVGDDRGAILRSDDLGESWTPRSGRLEGGVGALVVDPRSPSRVWAAARDGVYRSTDGGDTWRRKLASEEVVDVAVSRTRPDRVLAATVHGFFRSDDAGRTWRRVLDGHGHAVAIAPSDAAVAYAGTKRGVFVSGDGGRTWTKRSDGIARRDSGPIAVHPTKPGTALMGNNVWGQWVYHHDPFPASTAGEGIFRTADRGKSWRRSQKGLKDTDVYTVAVDPMDPSVVYVGTECSRGVYRSTDGGGDWDLIEGGPDEAWDIAHYTMKLAVAGDGVVHMSGRFGAARSTDRGGTWTTALPRRHFHGMGVSPSDPDLVLVGTAYLEDPPGEVLPDNAGAHIYRSTDGGVSWVAADAGFPAGADSVVQDFAFDPSDPDIVYAFASTHDWVAPEPTAALGIFHSTDGGVSWSAINSGLTSLEVQDVAVDPAMPERLFAGTDDGVFVSNDGGATWTATPAIPPVRALAIDPDAPQAIYAGTVAGLYGSTDGGGSWALVAGVPALVVTGLAMATDGSALYASVDEAGVYKGV